jgi:hypothetical protein
VNDDLNEPAPTRAQHPPSCRRCNGTGWQTGKPIYETVAGHRHRYDTVEPCTNPWHRDEPRYNEPVGATDPRAMAAQTAGYIDGQHELWVISHGALGAEDTTRRNNIA